VEPLAMNLSSLKIVNSTNLCYVALANLAAGLGVILAEDCSHVY
jgi:hypothetical protein